MTGLPPLLNPESILPSLNCRRLDLQLFVLSTADSTNDVVKERFLRQDIREGLLVTAETQTRGRGRLGRSWHSPPGTGLYFSLLLQPPIDISRFPQITLLAGVAVVQALSSQTTPALARLKWPNDVLLNGKKLCGILCELCESPAGPGVVVGIGVNVNQLAGDFPPELQTTAISLRMAGGAVTDRNTLLRDLICHLDREYDEFLSNGPGAGQHLAAQWSARSDMFGKTIVVTRGGERLRGTAVGLSENGNLLLQTADGKTSAFASGEASVET
jgi:BirA family biotin operon repressor/biotin-[acetyl-CoA-carboxylase] ligase